MDDTAKRNFQQLVWEYYHEHGRHDLPWRQPDDSGHYNPYRIMVSELMLQQTQVPRVIPKYGQFLELFPSLKVLAAAELGDVLRAWSGLGYNRRAKYLQAAAKEIAEKHGGQFPEELPELMKLPGIGAGTAGAIMAYTFDKPVIFLETNIRTALIHHFFQDRTDILDRELEPIAAAVVDTEQPREWYWAVTDYGAYLKRAVGNLNRHSRSYTTQSRFEGSARQIRGQVLRSLHDSRKSKDELEAEIHDERLDVILSDLVAEQMITRQKDIFSL